MVCGVIGDSEMKAEEMIIGKEYNFRNQPERLIYIGNNFSRNGYWHQFEKVSERGVVWSEMQPSELDLIELTLK